MFNSFYNPNPFSSYRPAPAHHPFYPRNPYGYGSSYEDQRRAQILAAQRERERQEALSRAQAERQRQYQRARQYLPDEGYDYSHSYLDDDEDMTYDPSYPDRYDYGFGRRLPHPAHPAVPQHTKPESVRKSRSPSPPHRIQVHSPTPPQSNHTSGSPPKTSSPRTYAPPSPPTTPPPAKRTPSPPAPQFTPEELEKRSEAALTIQHHYRVHKSLSTISSLESKFTSLFDEWESQTKPSLASLDFDINRDTDSGVVSVPVSSTHNTLPTTAKLAYTHANRPIHAYVESLNRLLVSLDGVDSWGEKRVRERRKDVVRRVEVEVEKVEAWVKSVASGSVSVSEDDVRPPVETTTKEEIQVDGTEEDVTMKLPEGEPPVEDLTVEKVEPDVSMDSLLDAREDNPVSSTIDGEATSPDAEIVPPVESVVVEPSEATDTDDDEVASMLGRADVEVEKEPMIHGVGKKLEDDHDDFVMVTV